jgi:ribose transport system permease protein
MGLGIDFHYADSWADPGKQPKPRAWAELEFDDLVTAVYDFTYDYIGQLMDQGTTPDKVAVGNEIINGFLYGSEAAIIGTTNPPYFDDQSEIYQSQPGGGLLWRYWGSDDPTEQQLYDEAWDRFATLVASGISAVRAASAQIKVEIHVIVDMERLAIMTLGEFAADVSRAVAWKGEQKYTSMTAHRHGDLEYFPDGWICSFKRQAIPGRASEFDMTFDEPGVYPGNCALYCGLAHADMTFTVRVLPPEQFEIHRLGWEHYVLRLAAVIGVVSIGMTFVITGGGIDLSVGAIVALSSVWCTTLATQTMATETHWLVMVVTAIAVGAGCGLVNGLLVSYGGVVPFIATLAMLASARGLAEIISDRRTQIVSVPAFRDVFSADLLGIPVLVWIFALVSVIGWVLLNRTTFGRRTVAVGGNPEAARLAGIDVKRHTVLLYVLVGVCCGFAAIMLVSRTTTGSATHGLLYELDAIAAVVIGGTLLSGGRGTILGTDIGVLIFTTLSNVFTLNNLSISAQSVVKGLIIVVAVLLQQRLARRSTTT